MKKMILSAVAAVFALTACDKCDKDDDGRDGGGNVYRKDFVVNGVTWAPWNVTTPGEFAAHPADYGGYFEFEPAQKACPAGWRTPTQAEWAQLFSLPSHETVYNGIKGRLFGVGEHNTRAEMLVPLLFLPMGGNCFDGELAWVGDHGYYWTGTISHHYVDNTPNAYAAHIDGGHPEVHDGQLYDNGFSVRCVKTPYYQ